MTTKENSESNSKKPHIDEIRMIYSIAQQVRKQLESLERLISNSGFPIRMDWEFKDEKKLTELDKSFIKQFLKNY